MVNPKDLYIITTARKRDTHEWEDEMIPFIMTSDPDISIYKNKIVIDSWNNIKKYVDVYNAFFIFDEDRVTGSGTWVKSFLKITNKNSWILLSATPGDCWMDYWAVFTANRFYRNKTDFINQHVIYRRFSNYPQISGYFNERKLEELRDRILIPINYENQTEKHHIDIQCNFDRLAYKTLARTRWNHFDQKPIETAAELCYLQRKVVNSDPSRLNALIDIWSERHKIIVFYSYNYELDLILSLNLPCKIKQWNGHKHQPLPEGPEWVYLVNYAAGAEGWNCISCNTIVFFSQQYSYKVFKQTIGRIDRRNTPFKDLYYYHLKSNAPIDMAIARALRDKKDFNERRYCGKW